MASQGNDSLVPTKPRKTSRWISRAFMVLSLFTFVPVVLTIVYDTGSNLFTKNPTFYPYFVLLWGGGFIFVLLAMFWSTSAKRLLFTIFSMIGLVLVSSAIVFLEIELSQYRNGNGNSLTSILEMTFIALFIMPAPTILLSYLIGARKVKAWLSYLLYPFLFIFAMIPLLVVASAFKTYFGTSGVTWETYLNNISGGAFLLSTSLASISMMIYLFSLPRYKKAAVASRIDATTNGDRAISSEHTTMRSFSGGAVAATIVGLIVIGYIAAYYVFGIYGTYYSLLKDPASNQIIFPYTPMIVTGECQYISDSFGYTKQYNLIGNEVKFPQFVSFYRKHGYLLYTGGKLDGTLPNEQQFSGELKYIVQDTEYIIEFENDGSVRLIENAKTQNTGVYSRNGDVIIITYNEQVSMPKILVKYKSHFYYASFQKR